MIRWDLATDEFEAGQWLFHTVAGGALSPDGRLLVYQAHNSKYNIYYNAVSRPPYFTALALWDVRSPYGEVFFWTTDKKAPRVPPPTKGLVRRSRYRLTTDPTPSRWVFSDAPPRRALATPFGELVQYWDHIKDWYSLNDDLLGADWVDVDHPGRLLFTCEGRVFVRDEKGEREFIDRNPFEFRPLAPPAWATEWP